MRRQLRLLSLMIAFCAFFQVQLVTAQNQNVLFLPGGAATSSLTVPVVSAKITTYPFTIEMWVKPNTITPYGGFFYDKSGGTIKTCLQFANATTGEMRFDLLGGTNIVPLTAATKLVVNKWQHLAVTVYKDSAVVEINGTFYSAAHTKAFGAFGSAASTIGVDLDAAGRNFNGYMDEVRIWKSARSRSEIMLYKDSVLNPAAQSDLVAYYNFNDLTANDATANALNTTKGTTAFVVNTITDARLGALSTVGGILTPSFNPDSLSYGYYAPISASISGVVLGDGATVTNSPSIPYAGIPNFSMVTTSKDGLNSKTYAFKTTFMPFSSWSGEGKTGAGTEPSNFGWGISDVPLAWGIVGGSNNRYNDVTATGWNYNNGTTTTAWTGRDMYIRWDGTGATTLNSIYSYPVYMEGCKTYEFFTKYTWVNNAAVPTMTIAVSKDRLGTAPLVTETAVCSSTKQTFLGKKVIISPSTSGVYYLTFKGNTASIIGLADMTFAESTTAMVNSNLAALPFTDATKTFKFIVTGNALTDTIKITAPAGVVLSKSFVLASDAPCGVEVTATNDYSQPLTSGNITLTSGTTIKTIPFTYALPSVSIYEQDVEVENNGKPYPLNVASVNNTVDSLYVTASAGLTLVKSAFGNADFVAGAGSIKVNVSSAVAGTTGTLIFSTKKNVPATNLDTVNVAAVVPYVRYYIKHKASSLVIGSFTTGLYPALNTAQGLVTQKFILRRTAPLSLTDTSFYMLQDTAYRAVRKIASSGWDTEFGVPSNEAKWTIQQKAGGIVTLTNVVTAKVLGTDAGAVNGRMYDDKVWTTGGNMEWVIQQIPVLNVTTKVLPTFKAYPTTTATTTTKIGGSNILGNVKVVLSGANAAQFKVSYDSLIPALGVVTDSTLTVTYAPTIWGTHTAKLTISSSMAADVVIDLSGIAVQDLTSSIVNPTIEAASGSVVPNGWTISKGTGNSYSNTGQHYSLVTTNRYLDSWNGTAGSMIYNAAQIVKNIPNGVYDLVAAGRSSGLGAYIFANDKQTQIINNADVNGALGKGWNLITVSQVVVMDSTITIGAKTTTGWTGTWFSADDFKLSYYGQGSFTAYKTVLDSLIAKAQRFDLTTSPDGLDVLLTGAIATAQASTDADGALASYTALKKAYDANVASVANFAKLKTLIASSTTLSTTTAYNATALTAFKAAITAANAVVIASSTMPADVDASIVALNKALYDYKVTQPAPADFTFALANPSFEDIFIAGVDPKSTIPTIGNKATPNGWNVLANIDATATGMNLYSASGASMADGNWGYETWCTSGKFISVNVSQKIVAPAAGYYVLTGMLRCDGSSPSSTYSKLYDGHVYAQVGNATEVDSKKLAEAAGLITGTGWNTKAAWRTLSLSFKANVGDTIKLGAASTSFMQMDNFTLAYKGNNNPATLDVAYITFQKAMDATADSVQVDPVYRMLAKDTLLNVSLKVLTDVSATATFDMTPYDAMIIQESFSSTAAILKPAGALALSKFTAPTLVNKSYTFKAGGAFLTGAAGAGAEANVGTFAIKVDSINKTNPLFSGLTFVADTVQLFIAGASDIGAVTANPLTAATCKALNGANAVVGAEGTLLAYPTGMTPAISINNILAGDTIGGQITGSRIITMNMNFGALCREHGLKMTNANYTLWRNAVYSLVGLAIPTTPMNVVTEVAKPADVNGSSIVVYPNPTTSSISISNMNLNSIVKIYSMTGQQVFMGKSDSNVMTVDMSRFTNGMYMLQVVSNGKALKSKIIKK